MGGLAPRCLARLREEGLRVDVRPVEAEAELEGVVDGCEGLIVAPGVRVTSGLLDAGRALEVVGCAGADVGGIDVDAATRRGIVVVRAPDVGVVSEAERLGAGAGGRARPARRGRRALRGGDAASSPGDGVEVRGKTLGLFGVRERTPLLAERARALGMTVLACEVAAHEAAATAGVVGVE